MLRLLISRGLKFQAALVVLASLVLAGPFAPRTLAQTDLFVASRSSNEILRFDALTGSFVSVFSSPGTTLAPTYMTFGPDGDLYVSREGSGVYRYDGVNGAIKGLFTIGAPVRFGALLWVRGLAFGPDGNLYVAYNTILGQASRSDIYRFHGTTGQYLDTFVPNIGSSGSLLFGPDGNLYVTFSGAVQRYNGLTGASMGNFVPAGSGGLSNPLGLAFGPDGNLYVSTDGDTTTASVRRYNGTTGAFIDVFVPPGRGGLRNAYDLAFGPDRNLYVSSNTTHGVLRYHGATGAFLDTFATRSSLAPWGLLFRTEASFKNITIYPQRGGNSGQVSARIICKIMQPGATVALTAPDKPSIVGNDPQVSDYVNTQLMQATFDLRGAPPGPRDVVITQPDGSTIIRTNAFTVEEGGEPKMWVNIVGRDAIRGGRPQTYHITYGNRGNIDSASTTIWFAFPKYFGWELGFTNTSTQIVSTSETDTEILVAIRRELVEPGFTGDLPISLTLPDDPAYAHVKYTIRGWVKRL